MPTSDQLPMLIMPVAPQVAQVTANQSQVGDQSTAQGQMTGLLKQDSGYMNLARQHGKRMAASRGLLNSSLAAGASMAEATKAALPIAQQDASTYLQNQRDNDARTFAAGQLNAQAENTANMAVFDADSRLYGSRVLADQDYGHRRGLAEQGYGHQRGVNEQQFGFQTRLSDQSYNQQRGINEQQFGHQKGLNEQQFGHQRGLSYQEFDQARERERLQFGHQSRLSDQTYNQNRGLNEQQFGHQKFLSSQDYLEQRGLNEQTGTIEQGLQTLKGQQAVDLAFIEANYKNILQTSASAQEMWKEYNNSINELVKQKDLPGTHVKNALAVHKDSLTAGLALLSAIGGLDLRAYAASLPTINSATGAGGGFNTAANPAPPPPPPPRIPPPRIPPPGQRFGKRWDMRPAW